MRYIIAGLMLLCNTVTQASFREMSKEESEQCFRAIEFEKRGVWVSHRKFFVTTNPVSEKHTYKDFQKNGAVPDMIFGTGRMLNGEFCNMFLPSYKQTCQLMESLETDVVQYLKQQKGLSASDIKDVIGLYPMPNTIFGLRSKVPYKKIPCTEQYYLPDDVFPSMNDKLDPASDYVFVITQECPVIAIVNDMFDVGDTEFRLIEKILDTVLPNMTDTQLSQFKIVLSAVYLQNGGQRDATVNFAGQTYAIGVVNFHGSVSDRLMAHAKLRVMDDYIASQTEDYVAIQAETTETIDSSWFASLFASQPTQPTLKSSTLSKKDVLLALSEKERCDALRDIFDNAEGLKEMAYERYLKYVAPDLIYKLAVNDFVEKGWINQESADSMRIAMPTTPVSATSCLDLEKPLQTVFLKKGIKHFLEPIFYLPCDGILLDKPTLHARVVEEHTGRPDQVEVEANLLTLQQAQDGPHFYCLQEGWLNLCQSRDSWTKGETIGVVLLDPYGKDKHPPFRKRNPGLLPDAAADMKKELQDNGYQVQFFSLSRSGHFSNYSPTGGAKRETYPRPNWKQPMSCKLVEDTVRVVWDAQDTRKGYGVLAGLRTST